MTALCIYKIHANYTNNYTLQEIKQMSAFNDYCIRADAEILGEV